MENIMFHKLREYLILHPEKKNSVTEADIRKFICQKKGVNEYDNCISNHSVSDFCCHASEEAASGRFFRYR